MDQIEFPLEKIWNARRDWFESEFDIEQRGGAYILGEHASALLIDLQAMFCVGAFVSTIIISCTIVDAHLREAELRDSFQGNIRDAFATSGFCNELEWLRSRRNRLVHFNAAGGPTITVDDHYLLRAAHENEARQAIQIVAAVLFENPWV
jgi:hypothetical protein